MKLFTRKKCFALFATLGALVYWLFPDRYPIYPESDHYNPSTQQFFNPEPSRPVERGQALSNAWAMIAHPEQFAPTQPLPTETPDWQAFLAPSDTAKLVWLGHSTLLMRMANRTLLIDPVWAEYASPVPIFAKRFQAPPVPLEALPPIDAIVYSHNHYDHLDEAVVAHFAKQNTAFFAPLGMGVLLKKWGVASEKIQEMDWWQAVSLGENFANLTLTAVPARHNSGRGLFDHNKTLWNGYVFQTAQQKIYYTGDSAYMDGSHFQQIGERFGGFDLALMENGQYNPAWADNHQFPEQTALAAKAVRAERVVPVHWGAYILAPHAWNEPIQRLKPLLEAQQIPLLTPKLGQVFDAHTPTEEWWKGAQ